MFSWIFDNVATLSSWLQIILCIAFLIIGFFLLIKGANYFVGSASSIAKRLKVSALIIGLTLVSLGTSLPEVSVGISSAITKNADISVGNIVGSNLFNLLVVLGFFAIFKPFIIERSVIKKDVPIMIISSMLLLLFALLFNNNNSYTLLRWECVVFLLLLIIYMTWNIRSAKNANVLNKGKINNYTAKNNSNNAENEKIALKKGKTTRQKSLLGIILLLIIGVIFIALGGEFVTFGAKNIAVNFGMSEALIGLTIVAMGTSLPEFTTSIVAVKKGENGIAIGNVIGSNIINVLLVLGVAGTISPLLLSKEIIIDIIIMNALFICFFAYILFNKNITKKIGWAMLIAYFIYLTYIIYRNFSTL